MGAKKRAGNIVTEIVMIVVGLIFLAPFYFLFVNSVKPFGEILKNAASWPSQFHWENYSKAWELARFSEAFRNSVIITVISVILITLFSAMAAYRMVRADTKFNRLLLLLFVAAMV
ncbi:carbohydrate ABC transporter permease, partial [Paenibacillus macerans]|nr:carbohydrate ABC transporter permease [Paenibacillus macerans]